jgi:hypothetical protein
MTDISRFEGKTTEEIIAMTLAAEKKAETLAMELEGSKTKGYADRCVLLADEQVVSVVFPSTGAVVDLFRAVNRALTQAGYEVDDKREQAEIRFGMMIALREALAPVAGKLCPKSYKENAYKATDGRNRPSVLKHIPTSMDYIAKHAEKNGLTLREVLPYAEVDGEFIHVTDTILSKKEGSWHTDESYKYALTAKKKAEIEAQLGNG